MNGLFGTGVPLVLLVGLAIIPIPIATLLRCGISIPWPKATLLLLFLDAVVADFLTSPTCTLKPNAVEKCDALVLLPIAIDWYPTSLSSQ